MLKNIKKVLLYNSGGGLGDSLSMIPIIQWLKDHYQLSEIYYIQNGVQKYFENSLKTGPTTKRTPFLTTFHSKVVKNDVLFRTGRVFNRFLCFVVIF